MRSFIIGSIIVLIPLGSYSQQTVRKDSLYIHADTTTRVDTLKSRKDTSAAVGGVDTVVNYNCTDSIVYSFATRVMSMYNKSDVKQKRMELKAERIDVNWNTSVVDAFGVRDTSDTTGKKYIGSPTMKDGGEDYKGFKLGYNFKTKKGKIDVGDTEIDNGYYHGETIKKVDKDILFVADGRYTTCDEPEPHYYFFSPKMKVTMQDKVIAEPVYFYIADVPVFALPLGVFPNKGGRRSGIIAPAYGDDGRRGKFLSHIGYYWAISDYMDINFRTDQYSKGGWAAYSDYRYALRYNFTGSISGDYKKLHTGEESDPKRSEETSYRLNILHNQEINPTTRLNVNFTFASNNSYLNTNNLQEALQQSIFSNATLSKYWEGTPNSITLNVSRRQNLVDGSIAEILPSISFNHSQSYPFRFGKKSSGEESKLAWYEMIGVNYAFNASNQLSKTNRKIGGIKENISGRDTVVTVEEFERDRQRSISQSVGIGISPKLGHFTISPSLSYRDDRSFIDNEVPVPNADSSLVFTNVQDTRRAGYLSTGVSVGTKFYGMANLGFLGVSAFRHSVTPNLSFSYQKQIIGEDRFGKQMFAGFNIGNNFEMKLNPEGEGKEPKKIQLLNIGAGISYNFTADSMNFSPIGVNYRTGIGELLNIGGDAGFDLYKLEEIGPNRYNRVNKFLINEEKRLARLTNFRISLSTSLSGEKKKSTKPQPQSDTLSEKQPKSGFIGLREEEEPDFSIPWRLSLMFDYGENKVPPNRSRSSSVRGNLEFNLTENWKFSFSGGYDIINKEVVVPDINISRDLHCWIMNFSWTPIGNYRQYRLEIRVKAAQLRDVKVTKQGSDRGIY